jgi:hypothetical protein
VRCLRLLTSLPLLFLSTAAVVHRSQALEAMYAKYATPAPQGQDNLITPA